MSHQKTAFSLSHSISLSLSPLSHSLFPINMYTHTLSHTRTHTRQVYQCTCHTVDHQVSLMHKECSPFCNSSHYAETGCHTLTLQTSVFAVLTILSPTVQIPKLLLVLKASYDIDSSCCFPGCGIAPVKYLSNNQSGFCD